MTAIPVFLVSSCLLSRVLSCLDVFIDGLKKMVTLKDTPRVGFNRRNIGKIGHRKKMVLDNPASKHRRVFVGKACHQSLLLLNTATATVFRPGQG